MNRLLTCFGLILLLLCASVHADPFKPDNHVLRKTLRLLPGQAKACEVLFSSLKLHVKYSYFIIPNILLGSAFAVVQSPENGGSPLLSELYQSGDSDRLGFAHYYGSRGVPMSRNGKPVYLASVILDVCPDQTSEAAVVMNVPLPLPTGMQSCTLATSTWNRYCR